jgi:hypothetical protein
MAEGYSDVVEGMATEIGSVVDRLEGCSLSAEGFSIGFGSRDIHEISEADYGASIMRNAVSMYSEKEPSIEDAKQKFSGIAHKNVLNHVERNPEPLLGVIDFKDEGLEDLKDENKIDDYKAIVEVRNSPETSYNAICLIENGERKENWSEWEQAVLNRLEENVEVNYTEINDIQRSVYDELFERVRPAEEEREVEKEFPELKDKDTKYGSVLTD